MKRHPSTLALPFVLLLAGCGALPEDEETTPEAPAEEVATAQQAYVTSSHAQVFGPEFGNASFDETGLYRMPVVSGDINQDGTTDLLVGAPTTHTGGVSGDGEVTIFWGQTLQGNSFGGLTTVGSVKLRQPASQAPEPGDGFGAATALGDFNCDGHPDIAVGAPGDTQAANPSATGAGNVTVFYGPWFTSFKVFWQGTNAPGAPEADDNFGSVLAVGNFNGDTVGGHACDDLAIGVPFEDVGNLDDAGAVFVLYGASTGLNGTGARASQIWHQDVGTVVGVAEAGDLFGTALAVGDFNRSTDGYDDLVIGVPSESYPAQGYVGMVQILKGSANGLTDTGNYTLELDDFAGLSLQEASMGWSLARGDFDGDGDDDLAIGAPDLAAGGPSYAGGVLIYRQSGSALSPSLYYHQDTANVDGVRDAVDFCGTSLAVGDFNGDGKDDLASGCPGEDVVSSSEGALNIAYFGLASGALTITKGQIWHKDSPGIPDTTAYYDRFSASLAAGDFNGDGKSDLAATSAPFSGSSTPTLSTFYGAP